MLDRCIYVAEAELMVLRQLDFTYAYGFANRVVRAVCFNSEEEPFLHDHLDGEDSDFLVKISKPCRDTVLHEFIRNLNFGDLDYMTGHDPELNVNEFFGILDAAGMQPPEWLTESKVAVHVSELDQMLLQAMAILTNAVFHILFADRRFLFAFQEFVAERIAELSYKRHQSVLRRQDSVPILL